MSKNIHYFAEHEEYLNYEKKAVTPHVSYTEQDDLVRYNQNLDLTKQPLTFEFIEDGTFYYNRTYVYYYYYYIYCKFTHIRNGVIINTINTQNAYSFNVQEGDIITVEYSSSYDSTTAFYQSTYYYYRFSSTAYCYVYGNIMSLDPSGLDSTTISRSSMFRNLFNGFSKLLSHPVKKLYLPATTLKTYCYYYMFNNCTGLTTAPELPATTLVSNCYYGMFYGCSSLNEVKAAFITVPSETITVWLQGVSSSGVFYKNNLATWTNTGPSGIPTGWIVKRYIV